MSLSFPTIAEQVFAAWIAKDKTTSLATLAKARGADVWKSYWPRRQFVYTFDDDTSLVVTGSGRNYQILSILP